MSLTLKITEVFTADSVCYVLLFRANNQAMLQRVNEALGASEFRSCQSVVDASERSCFGLIFKLLRRIVLQEKRY